MSFETSIPVMMRSKTIYEMTDPVNQSITYNQIKNRAREKKSNQNQYNRNNVLTAVNFVINEHKSERKAAALTKVSKKTVNRGVDMRLISTETAGTDITKKGVREGDIV
ncbi:hypothetical protein PGB90_003264 [Kerria lacca]